MKNRMILFVVFLLTSGLLSCVTVQPEARQEPNIIVIRNLTYDDLKTVYLSAVPKDNSTAVRFGSVSPVPRGISQSVVRARTAPPLPPELLLRWTDKYGKESMQRVAIQDLLAVANGAENEALVISIHPDTSVQVRIEYLNSSQK